MFPRAALVIAALLVAVILGLWIRAGRVARVADCQRGIVQPYERLLDRMQQLADAGDIDQLRTLITRARQQSGGIAGACIQPTEDSPYAQQVWELTQ